MLVREREIIPPRGSTLVRVGDHVFLVMRPGLRPLVDRIFRPRMEPAAVPVDMEFPLRGDTTVAELEEFYGVALDFAPEATRHDVLTARLGDPDLDVGSRLGLESVDLVVHSMYEGMVDRVGLSIHNTRVSNDEPTATSPAITVAAAAGAVPAARAG